MIFGKIQQVRILEQRKEIIMEKKIIQGFPTPTKDYYKVYVRSITYNQSQYIEDCLNGVAMQKTDFPFVHHVIDDSSTDGEQEIIKAWIERECDLETAEYYDNDICSITIAKNKSNPSCTLAVYFLKKNMFRNPEKRNLYKLWESVCPYEALCEGDDYWTGTLKLQMQVDFLEANPDYGLVHTNNTSKNLRTGEIKEEREDCIDGQPLEELLLGKFHIHTLTVCFRKCLLDKFSDVYKKNIFLMGDYPMWLELAYLSKIKYMPEIMANYNICYESASNTTNALKAAKFHKDTILIRIMYAELYGLTHLLPIFENDLLKVEYKIYALTQHKRKALNVFLKSRDFSNIIQFLKYLIFPCRYTKAR